jgi:hypothetical protein
MAALTVTVPAAVAVSVVPLINAPVVPASATVQVMALLVALAGSTVPVRGRAVPTTAVEGKPLILSTGIKAAFTVMVKSWVKGLEAVAPLAMVALIVTVPAEVVISVLPLINAPVDPAFVTAQVMALSVASAGDTVALRLRGVPAVAVGRTPVILLTGIKAGGVRLTVMINSWL